MGTVVFLDYARHPRCPAQLHQPTLGLGPGAKPLDIDEADYTSKTMILQRNDRGMSDSQTAKSSGNMSTCQKQLKLPPTHTHAMTTPIARPTRTTCPRMAMCCFGAYFPPRTTNRQLRTATNSQPQCREPYLLHDLPLLVVGGGGLGTKPWWLALGLRWGGRGSPGTPQYLAAGS